MERLAELTEGLLQLTKEAEHFYIDTVKNDPTYEVDFYGQVKPFADKVQPMAQEWFPLAKTYLVQNPIKNLHVAQLDQTVENLDVVAIKSFYPSSGMKRQRETFKSVEYVLAHLHEELKNDPT
ncbi:hypothetical protein JOC54_003487 [Alkalihalobacillus xiaoxiensis]|uniref:DUF1798 family protein n=1 Tax=Shouchella xiaoxiensis TaxID=766895 RepID=A0ABS2T152_9BACI|nr:YppE family protein [Shouchella xiaoxiensis]MBM7840207.1 hypothetical protein [Shouchella xiaoxiensis]